MALSRRVRVSRIYTSIKCLRSSADAINELVMEEVSPRFDFWLNSTRWWLETTKGESNLAEKS